MTKRFLIQCLFLIAVASVLGNYRVLHLPWARAQVMSSPVVFSIRHVIYEHRTGGADRIMGDKIMTKYEDGMYVEDSSVPSGLAGERAVRTESSDGKVEVVIGALARTSTWWTSNRERAAFSQTRFAKMSNNCVDPHSTDQMLWNEDVQGVKTVVVQEPAHQMNKYKIVHTEWRAPSLACIAVKVTNQTYSADGSEFSKVTYEPEYIRQTLATSRPEATPASFSELKPSEIQQQWADHIKVPLNGISCFRPERLAQMDSEYAKHQQKP